LNWSPAIEGSHGDLYWEYPDWATHASPGKVYRGVTQAEYTSILNSGSVHSTCAYSGPGQGTCFAPDAASALSYAQTGRDNPARTKKPIYVLELEQTPEMTVFPRRGEIEAKDPVPNDHVLRVWRFNPDGSVSNLPPPRIASVVSRHLMLTRYPRKAFLKRADAVIEKTEFQGIPISLDRPEGFVQKLDTPEGPKERVYTCDYGFFPDTEDHDGEELDVFVGPNMDSDRVWVIRQNKHDGTFDEHKCFIGFSDVGEVVNTYSDHIPAKLIGGIEEIGFPEFKAIVEDGGFPPESVKRVAARYLSSGYS